MVQSGCAASDGCKSCPGGSGLQCVAGSFNLAGVGSSEPGDWPDRALTSPGIP